MLNHHKTELSRMKCFCFFKCFVDSILSLYVPTHTKIDGVYTYMYMYTYIVHLEFCTLTFALILQCNANALMLPGSNVCILGTKTMSQRLIFVVGSGAVNFLGN